ncbi:DUF444 family protein [Duganella sp. PWIR1]
MRSDWYSLFSRGARDWLRHNDKVREAARLHLPDAIAAADLMTAPGRHGVQVPVKVLEHARFRLARDYSSTGAGQGPGQPGDILRCPDVDDDHDGRASTDSAEVTLQVEFSINDILDSLWDEFQLPQLEPRGRATLQHNDMTRAGWDKRGAPSRLDRRRTVKEAIKRRAVQPDPAAFTNDDLRFRQLLPRPAPASSAVLFFLLDVSSSMGYAERRLAKTFFYLALHGLRRKYHQIAIHFLAHGAEAWEFSEQEFFAASGMGGTVASSGMRLCLELLALRYDRALWNSYLLYASDGDNFAEDHFAAGTALGELAKQLNYLAYVETVPGMPRVQDSEMLRLWKAAEGQGSPMSSALLADDADVYTAIRHFLTSQAAA